MESTPRDAEKLLERLLRRSGEARALLGSLDRNQRRELLRQILAHVDVLLAQGHRAAARTLLHLGARVAGGDRELAYRLERKWVDWYQKEGLPDQAVLRLQALFERYRGNHEVPQRAAELAMELGILLDRMGRKEDALARFQGASRRYQRVGHAYNRAAALFNTASVLYDLGLELQRKGEEARAARRFRASLEACRRALEEGGADPGDLEAPIALQMANTHEASGHRFEAEEFYRCAAEAYRRLGNRRQASDILYRLGWLKRRRGQHALAEPILNRALQLRREYDYGAGLARYHLHRGESYRAAGVPEAARHHYRACLSIAAVLHLEELCRRARFGLYLVGGRDRQPLSTYLKLPAPPGGEASVERGRYGVYCEQSRDGASTVPWRQSGGSDAATGDRTFLARLLRELSQTWHQNGVEGHEGLARQEQAVWSWQARRMRGQA